MVNNSENILVEFDYQNITVIDPNKVVDNDGNVKERLLQHEDLVYYANLECALTPRTKLAIGVPQEQNTQTVSVGNINFLNPGFKKFLDTGWSDELTGKGSVEGKGTNQPNITETTNPDLSSDYYTSQVLKSNGVVGATDNGLLGITQINISYGLSFLTEVNITMEDIKGRALFEAGNNSPYAAFFNLPYPIFYLTIKGYLGKATRLPLMLQTFNASFDPSTHNFRIQCKFFTYKYTIMGNVTWGQMMSTPQMYRIKIDTTNTSSTNTSDTKSLTRVNYSSGGYQKMRELYSEYKSKGLIDDDFPEITIVELKKRLDLLLTNIENNFKKKNLNVLNDLTKYSDTLREFQTDVYFGASLETWSRKWLDYSNTFIQKDVDKTTLYAFKKEFSDPGKQKEAITELNDKYLKKYVAALRGNSAVGKEISVDITPSTFFKKVTINDINIGETLTKRTGKQIPDNTEEYSKNVKILENEIINGNTLSEYPGLAFFTGPNSFQDAINKIDEKFLIEKEKLEKNLTKEIADQFADKNNGLGFQPTIRNILAVFFAQGEAFLRLMDDVHTKAWNLKDDESRRRAIFNESLTTKSVDVKPGDTDKFVYPWPQLIVENLIDGKEKYELRYPGDILIANKINAYIPEIWPEVQFVEEYIRAYVERDNPSFDFGDGGNQLNKPQRFSFNGIEFPIGNDVYQNTEEVKFLYEIYERMIINSFYSKFNRNSIKEFNIQSFVSESETTNIITALGSSNPILSKTLKEYNLNDNNYETFLRQISNKGQGISWQNFIRGTINTPNLQNDTINSFQIFSDKILTSNVALPNVGLNNETTVKNYFGVTNVNEDFDFTDTYPLSDVNWCKENLANGNALQSKNDVYKTSNTLQYDSAIKTVRNNDNIYPFTNFNFKSSVFNKPINNTNLSTFYDTRLVKDQYTTEGNLFFENYNGNVSEFQSTSIFNTPYFANAIQKGVNEFRYGTVDSSPYTLAAFLFLNSLPLGTLKDKYKTYETDGSITTLDYILPSFKKFGAVHKLPYTWILKYGSIWYRYKKYIESGVDVLDDIWKDIDYIKNYDPELSATTTQYQITINGQQYNIVLDSDVTSGVITQSKITTGFYPKLINDYNLFFQGINVFSESSQIKGTCYFSGNTMEVLSVNFPKLEPGQIISGSSVDLNTKIISQLTGTTGGAGQYLVEPVQTKQFVNVSASTQEFIITNKRVGGFTNQTIQNALDSNFKMVLNNSTVISKPTGFDVNSPDRSLLLTPWNCYTLTQDKQYIYTMPSLGTNVYQTTQECYNQDGTEKINVANNPAIHNGTTRLFWKAPNYGYFDNRFIKKPNPDEYLKLILNVTEDQLNFGLYGNNSEYSKIDDLFTTFTPEILDQFEEHFLNFSKSIYDFDSILQPNSDESGITTRNENFQALMREMFKTPIVTGLEGPALIDKITETQTSIIQKNIDEFMNYSVVIKIGNPSNFDKKLFYTFSTQFIQDEYTWNGYIQTTPNALPTSTNNVTLSQSKALYPETWKTLEKYIGFSEIPELKYDNNGSYITDFFVDLNIEFSENNIRRFYPIINLYATHKLDDPTLNKVKFTELMDDYIVKGDNYLKLILNETLKELRKKLGIINITTENSGVKFTEFTGDQTRLEIWETLKALNDKWISGGDFKTKTLFEDVLILDRASRDIGQKIFVDIFKLKDMIEYQNWNNSMLGAIQEILEVHNRFKTFIVPSYANFYNVQNTSKNPTPRPEGTLDFANTLFGTFNTIDYRETSAKYVSIYSNPPSTNLAMNENIDYRYRDDAFDLRRTQDNPLIENQVNKTDWDKSNKVVGFNVDFGPQNQQIFKQMDISQDPGLPTAESEQMLTQMANQYRNRGGASQSTSLYNIYKNRSYKCSIDMMGNALIQPAMYFNLRNVPLFSGPYMITNIQHRISENGFDTTFEGQRQAFYDLPSVDNILQALATTILETLRTRLDKQEKEIQEKNNIIAQKEGIISKINSDKNVLTANQNCSSRLNSSFSEFINTTPTKTSITVKQAIQIIESKLRTLPLTTNDKDKFLDFIIATMYIETGSEQKFVSYDHNYASINLNINPWGATAQQYTNKKYFCIDRGNNEKTKNIPLASFDSFDNFVDMFIEKFSGKVTSIENYIGGDDTFKEKLANAYVTLWPSTIEDSVWTNLPESDKEKLKKKINTSIEYIDLIYGGK